jgi:SH3-like domain-containing protein
MKPAFFLQKIITNRTFVVLGIVLLLFFAGETSKAAGIKMVSVAGEKLNMRKGPSTKYSVKWELGKGFPLRVIGSQGSWLKVSDFENDVGWVYKNLVNRSPHLIVKVNKKSKQRANIRSGPGTKYKIVGKAEYGVVFKTLKRGDGWVKVQHEDGMTGWVKRSLLWGW